MESQRQDLTANRPCLVDRECVMEMIAQKRETIAQKRREIIAQSQSLDEADRFWVTVMEDLQSLSNETCASSDENTAVVGPQTSSSVKLLSEMNPWVDEYYAVAVAGLPTSYLGNMKPLCDDCFYSRSALDSDSDSASVYSQDYTREVSSECSNDDDGGTPQAPAEDAVLETLQQICDDESAQKYSDDSDDDTLIEPPRRMSDVEPAKKLHDKSDEEYRQSKIDALAAYLLAKYPEEQKMVQHTAHVPATEDTPAETGKHKSKGKGKGGGSKTWPLRGVKGSNKVWKKVKRTLGKSKKPTTW